MEPSGHHASVKCYIDEYRTPLGQLAARLREKRTGRKVDIGFTDDVAQKSHFLQFVSGAGREAHAGVLRDLLEKDGDADSILVSGIVDFDSPDEIRFVYNDQIEYRVI